MLTLSNYITGFISIIGLVVTLYFAVQLFSIYRENSSKAAFLLSISALTLSAWNLIHVIFAFLREDQEQIVQYGLIYLAIFGIFQIIFILGGFAYARYEEIPLRYKILMYLTGALSTIMVTDRDQFFAVYYDSGWASGYGELVTVGLFLLVFWAVVELWFVYKYLSSIFKEHNNDHYYFLVGYVLLCLSIIIGGLSSIIDITAVRYLFATIGLVLMFMPLTRNPYLGFFDNSKLQQIITTKKGGLPLYSLQPEYSTDEILAASGLAGVDTLLQEISGEKASIKQIDFQDTSIIRIGGEDQITFGFVSEPTDLTRKKIKLIDEYIKEILSDSPVHKADHAKMDLITRFIQQLFLNVQLINTEKKNKIPT